MIYHAVEQRSDEWYGLRLGIPTASDFHRILTPTGKLSEQAKEYALVKLAEHILGESQDGPRTQWMIRGEALEDTAIAAYEFHAGCETERGGFCTSDDGLIGCSPDRLVDPDGALEMKCPAPNTHIGYMLDPDSILREKRPQVQGVLWIAERQWCDLMSYYPGLPPVVRRVQRDQPYIDKLGAAVRSFVELLDALRTALREAYGDGVYKPVRYEPPAMIEDGLGFDVTAEDVAAMVDQGITQPQKEQS